MFITEAFTLRLLAALAGCVLTSILGVAILRRGRRGRRVDDHPLCRRCGFDLTGLPAASMNCPECGAPVAAPKSRVIGHRRPIRVLIFGGLAVLLVGLAGSGYGTWTGGKRVAWVRYEPFGWVMTHAGSRDGAVRDPAVGELSRRLKAGALGASQVAALAGAALAAQGDRAAAWPAPWADLLADLVNAGRLSDAQVDQYVRQAVRPTLTARPVVRRGRWMNFGLHSGWDRLAPNTHIEISRTASPVRIGGADITHYDWYTTNGRWVADPRDFKRDGCSTYFLEAQDVAAVPDGPTALTLTLFHDVKVFRSPQPNGAVPKVRRLVVPLSTPITLAGHDATVDRFVVDPKQRAAMRAAVPRARVWTDGDAELRVAVGISAPPVPIAAEVVLRRHGDDGGTVYGHLQTYPNERQTWRDIGASAEWQGTYGPPTRRDFAGEVVDVVLRPSQDAVDSEEKLGNYWGEELVISDVQVDAPYAPPLNNDESKRAQVEAGITIEKVEVETLPTGEGKEAALNITFAVGGRVLVRLDYQVYVSSVGPDGGRAAEVTSPIRLTHHPSYPTRMTVDLPLPDERPGRVDVALRVNRDWEFGRSGATVPWAGEIRFRDIPVPAVGAPAIVRTFHPTPTTRPGTK